MTATIEQITLSNVGPIERATIPYLPEGGLIVLRGPQGCGKSTTLDALTCAATGKGKVSVKDGELNGRVEAFGVTLKLGSRQTLTGEPEVEVLGGRLDVGHLVDPQLKDPAAADRVRIKALVTLAGVKPSAEMFYPLLGDRAAFEAVVKPASLDTDDLVQMAEAVKRDLEAAARKEADQAEHAEGRARGAKEAAGDIDPEAECDSAKLAAAHESAIREQSRLAAEVAANRTAERAAQAARDAMEDADAGYSGRTLEEANEHWQRCKDAEIEAGNAHNAAVLALQEAKARYETARNELASAINVRKLAESHERMVAQWRQQITASIPPAPSLELISAADARVEETRRAVETGTLIRAAKRHLADCEAAIAEAAKHRKQSDRLREAAKGTDEVLSEAVAKTGSPLRVEAGRLIVGTKRRGKTRFAELSDGERWKLALDIAIDAVSTSGKPGFLAIPQWAYGELQPANRRAIAEHLQSRGVTGYTALATDDAELNAEVFGENGHD